MQDKKRFLYGKNSRIHQIATKFYLIYVDLEHYFLPWLFVHLLWVTHQNVVVWKENRFGRPFLPAEGYAISRAAFAMGWRRILTYFNAAAFLRDFSLEFQLVTFRNCNTKILLKHSCMKIKCSFRKNLDPFCAFAKTGAAYSFFFLSY